jgi:hypothetical protein
MTESDLPVHFAGHYKFSRADYRALITAMRHKSLRSRIIRGTLWLCLLSLVFALNHSNWTRHLQAIADQETLWAAPRLIDAILGGWLTLTLFLPWLLEVRAMRLYPSSAVAEQEYNIELGETGITAAATGARSRFEWSFVRSLIVTQDHLFLSISRREAVVVPRRAFANDFEFAAVTALARRKVPAVQVK